MSYETIETSVDDSNPVYLFEFRMGQLVWRYNNVDTPVTHLGFEYEPIVISTSDITSTADSGQAALTLKVTADNPVALLYSAAPPSSTVSLTIYSVSWNATGYAVCWKGRVVSASWDDNSGATINCESLFSSLRRNGLKRRAQSQCTYVHYGTDCGVSAGLYQETSEVDSVSGITVVVLASAGKPAGYYAGGIIEWMSPNGVMDRRYITGYNPATGAFTLIARPAGLSPGQTVFYYAGCDRSFTSENGCPKFENQNDYGGQPYLPNKKPFSGERLY